MTELFKIWFLKTTLERWRSGRTRRLAKPLMGSHPSGGSNPPFSVLIALKKLAANIKPARFFRARFFVFLSLIWLCSACIERRLVIRTEPKDARVFLDGLELKHQDGESREDFFFYGTRSLVVRKRGFETDAQIIHLDTPWHSEFPIDVFTELLWPGTILDERLYKVELKQVPPLKSKDTDALIERAQALAKEAGSEY